MSTCRKATGWMHELLDGTLADRAALDAHLQGCPACRSRLALLQRVHEAVAVRAASDVSDARLEGVTEGVLGSIRAGTMPGMRHSPWPAWASLAAAAALLAAFCLGGLVGGAIVGSKVPASAVATAPRVVERVVVKQMPVVRERIVERIVRVPVVRTRVIYRDRVQPQRAGLAEELSVRPASSVQRPVAIEPAPEIIYTQSLHLAGVVEPKQER